MTASEHFRNIRGLAALAVLAKQRNLRVSGLQQIVSLILIARSVPKQVISAFNHIGLCLSYTQSLEWVKRFRKENVAKANFSNGEWILVYDNINFHKKVRYERSTRQAKPRDFTSRLEHAASASHG